MGGEGRKEKVRKLKEQLQGVGRTGIPMAMNPPSPWTTSVMCITNLNFFPHLHMALNYSKYFLYSILSHVIPSSQGKLNHCSL